MATITNYRSGDYGRAEIVRVIDCLQGSEEWEQLRLRPTASQFHRIVTPARGGLAAGSKDYACELLARIVGAFVEPPPSFWQAWGLEQEPFAVAAYEQLNDVEATPVGFCLPDDHERWGCSPDRLVGDSGLLEVKCPKPETLIRLKVFGLGNEYRAQLQGQLLITGRDWVDLFVWHPAIKPFVRRVEPDDKYQGKLIAALDEFCNMLEDMQSADIGQEIVWHE